MMPSGRRMSSPWTNASPQPRLFRPRWRRLSRRRGPERIQRRSRVSCTLNRNLFSREAIEVEPGRNEPCEELRGGHLGSGQQMREHLMNVPISTQGLSCPLLVCESDKIVGQRMTLRMDGGPDTVGHGVLRMSTDSRTPSAPERLQPATTETASKGAGEDSGEGPQQQAHVQRMPRALPVESSTTPSAVSRVLVW